MGPPRFSSADSTSHSPRKASMITGQALQRNKRCWMGGRRAAKNPICMNWCCCQGDVLADQMPGLFHCNVLFMFFRYVNSLHRWEKFSSSKSRFFVKSSLVLKRTGTTLFSHKLVGFGELESWLRPAPTSCLCQQPLSLHSFSQGTKPSHTESTSWTAPENLKSN